MKKIFNRSRKHSKIFFLAVFAIVVIICIFGTVKFFSSKQSTGNDVSVDKYVGRMESIIEYGDRVTVVAHYPVTGNSIIDNSVLKNVEMFVTEFKSEIIESETSEGELHIDYDSYQVNDKYISISMTVEKNLSTYANVEVATQNIVYEIPTGKQLTINNIINDEHTNSFVEMISNIIKEKYEYQDVEQCLDNDIYKYLLENPYSFYLDKNGIVITFDEYSILSGNYGTPTITLPYNQVNLLFQKDFIIKEIESQMELQKETTSQDEGVRNLSMRKVNPSKPMVALTFDDGPHPEHTRGILKALKKYDAAATFYVLGNRASAYGDVVKEIIESGSELGNHSWSHINYSDEDELTVRKDKNKVQDRIKEIVGSSPKTIRVPYGALNDTVISGVEMPVVLWSVDTNDWKYKDKAKIVQAATENVKDGDIILMHDIWRETALAVPDIVKILHDRGFQLVTVSEMAEAKNMKLEKGKKYFSFK